MSETDRRRSWIAHLAGAGSALLLIGCGGTQVRESDLLGADARFDAYSEALLVSELDNGIMRAQFPVENAKWYVQEKPDYCWAACMQSLMSLHGVSPIPTQSELWQRSVANPLFEEDRDAATFEEILYALAPEYREQMPGYFVLESAPTDLSALVRELAAGEPVIVGMLQNTGTAASGHAYVAYGMEFREAENRSVSAGQAKNWLVKAKDKFDDLASGNQPDEESLAVPENRYEAVRLYLYDPDEPVPDAPEYGGGPKEFTLEQIKDRIGFAVSASSARRLLEDRLRWLREHDQGPGIYVRSPLNPQGSPVTRMTIADID